MQQQSSHIPEAQEDFEEGELNQTWGVHDIQNQQFFNDSPSAIHLQRNSRRQLRISTVSSTKSRPQLIKVSKVSNQDQPQKARQNECQSITGNGKRQCRICLEDQAEGRLVKPCKCIGSMQYAHQHCLSEWIKRKTNIRQKGKVHCEVCDYPFEYKICKRLSLSWESLTQNYQRHKSNYVCFLIVMLVLLTIWITLLGITCMGFGEDINWVKKYIMTVQQTRIIFVCVVIVFLIIMMFVSLLFVAEYGIKTDYAIKSIQNHGKKFKKIVPKLYYIAT